jgi:hypothetical protein
LVVSPRFSLGECWKAFAGRTPHPPLQQCYSQDQPRRPKSLCLTKGDPQGQTDAPGDDVVEKIDPKHPDTDFLRDLEKETSDRARKKLGRAEA